MEFLGEVIGGAVNWAAEVFTGDDEAPAVAEAPDYVPDEATADGAAGLHAHYVDDNGIEQEAPPPVPEERPDIPQEELDTKLSEISDTLARPDPADVSKAVTTLVGLSDEQRKQAIGQMSEEELDQLMDNLPPEEHERLGELVAHVEDPKRKLKMWKTAEMAELGREGRNLAAQPRGTEFMAPEDYFLIRQENAVSEGKTEVQDECDVAEAALEAGDLSPEKQKELVDDLIARKEKERDIEREHGVNVTNDRTEGHRRVWKEDELDDLAEVLHELPPDAARDNAYLDEIHRAARNERGDVGGYSNPRLIIYDNAMTDTQDHHGDKSELTGHDAGNPLKAVQQTIAHELGHSVEDSEGEVAFTKKVWKEESADDGAAKLAECEASGGAASDGRVYVQSGDTIYSYDPATMPNGGAHDGGSGDTWDYAHKRPNEYFAESYSKATMVPELYYQDMIAGPQAKIEELKAKNAPATEIAKAEEAAKNMAEQHEIMRTQVLGFDEGAVEDGADLVAAEADARGLSWDDREKLVEEYRAKAAMAMTPQQLERLTAKYAPPTPAAP